MGRKLGALQAAAVKLTDKDANGQPVVVTVGQGGELPDNLAPGEEKRLETAGAFAEPPRAVSMTVQEASAAVTGYLPPQVTLAANNDDGTPGDITAALLAPPPAPEATEPKETAAPRRGQR